MKEQMRLLAAVQEIDLFLDERINAKKDIVGQLDEHKSMLTRLHENLELQRTQLHETIALKAQREEELVDAETKFQAAKEKLMSVSSSKEYNAMEKEMENLKRKSEETRERLDHLKEAIEVAERGITDMEGKIAELGGQIENVEKEAASQITALDKEIVSGESRQDKARTGIKPGLLRRYDFIRSRRGGRALVPIEQEHCAGCFMSLPPQLVNRVLRGVTLEICHSCQSILYSSLEAPKA